MLAPLALALALVAACAHEPPEELPMGDPTTTSLVSTTTATSVRPAPTTSTPRVDLDCPTTVDAAGPATLVEFDARLPADGFARAIIDYGDGRSYGSADWNDAQENMFWHRYGAPGRYDVRVEATYDSGAVATGSCSFTLVEPPPPSTTTTTSPPSTATTAPPTSSAALNRSPANTCDPNYEGACVPIASDVDCASGSGNGPAYVEGPVYVVGSDVYDLDRDNDGVGCENG